MWRSGIDIATAKWEDLIAQLAARGENRREAGAFLLADRTNLRRVSDIVFYDDLDPSSLTGAVHLTGRAYQRLWDHCEDTGRTVVADIHTHPGQSTAQSTVDRANPLIDRAGHVAVIVPHYATRRPTVRDAGVHLYLGSGVWRSPTRWRRWRHFRVGLR